MAFFFIAEGRGGHRSAPSLFQQSKTALRSATSSVQGERFERQTMLVANYRSTAPIMARWPESPDLRCCANPVTRFCRAIRTGCCYISELSHEVSVEPLRRRIADPNPRIAHFRRELRGATWRLLRTSGAAFLRKQQKFFVVNHPLFSKADLTPWRRSRRLVSFVNAENAARRPDAGLTGQAGRNLNILSPSTKVMTGRHEIEICRHDVAISTWSPTTAPLCASGRETDSRNTSRYWPRLHRRVTKVHQGQHDRTSAMKFKVSRRSTRRRRWVWAKFTDFRRVRAKRPAARGHRTRNRPNMTTKPRKAWYGAARSRSRGKRTLVAPKVNAAGTKRDHVPDRKPISAGWIVLRE